MRLHGRELGPRSGFGGVPESGTGRWAALPQPVQDPTIRAHASAEFLLERYGVVTRGSVAAESVPGGFGQLYRVLGRLEEAGHARRGYFVERLGAAQFSTSPTIDRLRTFVRDAGAEASPPAALALAATDPANPYGAALAWPQAPGGHRPGRKAGAIVVLLDGRLALYVERGGKTVLDFPGAGHGGKHARRRGRRACCCPAPGRHREARGAQGQRRSCLRFALGRRITPRWILFHA